MKAFEYMSNLQYRVKSLARQVEEFKSGEKYRKMQESHRAVVRSLNGTIKKLRAELEKAHNEAAKVRKLWEEVIDDLEKEFRKELKQKDNVITKLKNHILELEKMLDQKTEELREKRLKLYEVETLLEEEREKNRKLTAQVNMNFENSSLPSSLQGPKKKKIPNSRKKTGKKPGGQPGHQGHGRKKHTPTQVYEIPAPKKYTEDPNYYETGKTIRKQKVIIQMDVQVVEYFTKEYRNRTTGARVHAPFPQGYTNEVNYDGSIKAFAFLLGNECNVSHDKIRKFLSEITEGKVEISKGMINGLCKEFAAKTKEEKTEICRKLFASPVLNVDFTNASVNGGSAQVLILASPSANAALYIARESKGHKGIQGTLLENYMGTIVHDHDLTFYSYGQKHQECMQHNCRYLIGSEQNEPELTWNQKMHGLFREMLHYRNGLGEDDLDPEAVEEFERRYDEILEKAREEYEYEPPSDSYREGYNLYQRLVKYKESELLFLHDKRVPANNSLCERLARVYKRKQKQMITMRSYEGLENLCDGLSIVYFLRMNQEGSVYQTILEMFERKLAPKKKKELVS